MSQRINTLIAEDKQYREWERAEKNKILNMSNHEKKQMVWREKFGVKEESSDDYLLGEVF